MTIINSIKSKYGEDSFANVFKYPDIPIMRINEDADSTLYFDNADYIHISEDIEGVPTFLAFSSDKTGTLDDFAIGIDGKTAFIGQKACEKSIYPEITKELKDISTAIITSPPSTISSYKSFGHLFGKSPDKTGFQPDSLYIIFGKIFGGTIPGSTRYQQGTSYSFRMLTALILDKKSAADEFKKYSENTDTYYKEDARIFADLKTFSILSKKLCIPTFTMRASEYGKTMPKTPENFAEWVKHFEID